ncbi:hypothetical protein [uncultured Chryseobacterium sp.]|uniref:hypothetical protein n=1 Tax=uncultured Chryseobacterium sp. TaxID=259322 RepID=UPI0025EBCF76|nr:hypothetical protein [uncultured Chryseobacterium sp.]
MGTITGNQNPIVGETNSYAVNLFGTIPSISSNASYEWYLFKKQKNGSWIDITKNGVPKKGNNVDYKFFEPVAGDLFEIRVFEVVQGLLPSAEPSKKLFGKLEVTPTASRNAQIDKVVLFNRGKKDVNKATYRDTLVARAFCTGLFGREIEFQLWEDDAPGKGHDATVNKNNKIPHTFKATVNEKGIAEVKIPLSADEKIMRQIADKFLMRGDRDEGANHEYYVTATYLGKGEKASQVNVLVANPDDKPRPKKDSPKFPATSTDQAPKQHDAKGKILDAYFTDAGGSKLTNVQVGKKVQVIIKTSGMVGKHIQYKVWEYDLGSNDLIYESGKIKVVNNLIFTDGFTISQATFGKGIDFGSMDSDAGKQNYFLEVIPIDISAESQKFGVTSDGLMEVENVKSPTMVKTPETKKGNGEKCFCNRDFEEKDVRKFVKLLKGEEIIWDWKNNKISDKSFSTLTKELNLVFKTYNINTCTRKMHFLSQVCEETGVFGSSEEGKSKYNSSVSIYKGRGLLQLTGVKGKDSDLYNEPGPYKDYANYISDQSVVNTPTVVATNVHYCIDSAGWIWSVHKTAPKFKEGKKDSQAIKDKKKRLREKYKDILGKTPNEIADFADKYQLEIGKVINGFHENTDPINQTTRKSYYTILKNSFFEYKKYHENIAEGKKEKINDEMVMYHIYSNGDIEKHIPKKIKVGYEKKYGYIYHDKKDEEHHICTVDWHLTKEKSNGTKSATKPTHKKITSDDLVTDGQTKRRVKYENGDIAEYGSNDGKTFWVLYKVTGNDIELVKMPDSLDYNSSGVVIKYTFTKTKRRYTDPGHLAVFIGTLAECGFTDVQTTGSCFSEASCFPSVEHVNGKSIDTLYLDDAREQKLIDAFNKFGITKQLRGNKKKAFNHTSDGKSLHNSHLHSGIIRSDKIKIIKEA